MVSVAMELMPKPLTSSMPLSLTRAVIRSNALPICSRASGLFLGMEANNCRHPEILPEIPSSNCSVLK